MWQGVAKQKQINSQTEETKKAAADNPEQKTMNQLWRTT